MKKSSYLLAMLALGLLSLSSAGGCSSEDPQDGNMSGSGGSGGGSGGGGGAPSGGAKMTGMQLAGSAAFTLLSTTDAPPGAAAPASFGTCSACHGAAAQGVKDLGPEIRHTPTTYSTYVIRNGRTGSLMAPYPESALASASMTEIQTWLMGLPKPTTGQGLYLDYCANCHGPTGGGGSVPVKASGLPTATITATVRAGAGADPAQRGVYMPAFGADLLSDGELSMIAQFLGGT